MQSLTAGLQAGGIFIYPLIALAVIAIACASDRLYVFLRVGRPTRPLARALADPEFDLARLRDALAKTPASNGFNRVFKMILANIDRPVWWIETRAADEAAIVERRLDRGLWILETIVTAAPLLGLLGTISGMIAAFRLFGESGAVDPGAVTGGVAEALIATALGIVIALVALAAYNYFGHRRAVTLDEIERLATRLIDRIRLEREEQA